MIEVLSDLRRSGTSAFAAGGGGGGASLSTATVSVVPAKRYQADATVTDANVTAVSVVSAALVPNADWDADDLADFQVFATPLEGSVVFTITRPGQIVGDFKIAYLIG